MAFNVFYAQIQLSIQVQGRNKNVMPQGLRSTQGADAKADAKARHLYAGAESAVDDADAPDWTRQVSIGCLRKTKVHKISTHATQ